MKIVELRAENIKRLRAVCIRPDPNSHLIEITGPNAAGKSSILDSIYMALAGKGTIDKVPVRQGEQTAEITLDLGKIFVRRIFRADGTTSVTVEATDDGARYSSPQTLLDGLLGALSLDPLEFARLMPPSRAEALRKLVKLDIDVDEHRRLNRVDFETRTVANRRRKELEGQLAGHVPTAVADMPEKVDMAAISGEMEQASRVNGEHDRLNAQLVSSQRSITLSRERATEVRLQIAQMQTQAEDYERRAAKEEEAIRSIKVPERVDLTQFRQRLLDAEKSNAEHDCIQRAKDASADLTRQITMLANEADELGGQMLNRDREIREAIAKAVMPIEGLTFGEDFAVLYRGLPFEQASSAEQLKVSVAIAMAMNPELRVLRIKDGSLLDEANLAVIAEMAVAGDYQVWLEAIHGGPAAIVMHDGSVQS